MGEATRAIDAAGRIDSARLIAGLGRFVGDVGVAVLLRAERNRKRMTAGCPSAGADSRRLAYVSDVVLERRPERPSAIDRMALGPVPGSPAVVLTGPPGRSVSRWSSRAR